MADILNLDEVLGTPKKIHWGGKEYPVKDMTLGFALQNKALEDKAQHGKLTADEDREYTLSIVRYCIPDFPIEDCPVRVIPRLVKYILGDDSKKKA